MIPLATAVAVTVGFLAAVYLARRGVPRGRWEWYGSPAHLIVGNDCRFHLATLVGPWLVSTVGEYLRDSAVREVLAPFRGVALEGRGDDREYDWMRKVGWEPLPPEERAPVGPYPREALERIDLERLYETMVFRAAVVGDFNRLVVGRCDCGCGVPRPAAWGELDSDGYMTAAEATAGHLAMCERWARVPYGDAEEREW